jgi:hypothetical protein
MTEADVFISFLRVTAQRKKERRGWGMLLLVKRKAKRTQSKAVCAYAFPLTFNDNMQHCCAASIDNYERIDGECIYAF